MYDAWCVVYDVSCVVANMTHGVASAFHGETHTMGGPPHQRNLQLVHRYIYIYIMLYNLYSACKILLKSMVNYVQRLHSWRLRGLFGPQGSAACHFHVLSREALVVEDDKVVDEDHVLGQLAGSATNQSGRRCHMTAPDCMALQEVVHEVMRQTQISALDVDAVESFADGKVLDDCLEATALARAYRPQGTLHSETAAPLGIVCAKSGAGNQLEAMGLSQIVKAVLAARSASIHPTPHLRTGIIHDNTYVQASESGKPPRNTG